MFANYRNDDAMSKVILKMMKKDFNGEEPENSEDESEDSEKDENMANELSLQSQIQEIKSAFEVLSNPSADLSEVIEATETLENLANNRESYSDDQRSFIEKLYLKGNIGRLFIEISERIGKNKTFDKFSIKTESKLYMNLVVILILLSDWSEKICHSLAEINVCKQILLDFKSPAFQNGYKTGDKECKNLIRNMIGLIWNILQRAPEAISQMRDNNGVEMLKNFAKFQLFR